MMPDLGMLVSMAVTTMTVWGSTISVPDKMQYVIVLILRALGMI